MYGFYCSSLKMFYYVPDYETYKQMMEVLQLENHPNSLSPKPQLISIDPTHTPSQDSLQDVTAIYNKLMD